MASFQEMRDKYYSQEGLNALSNRLKNIYGIYISSEEKDYPLTFQMFGFPPLKLVSKEECLGHIHELEQILICKVGE